MFGWTEIRQQRSHFVKWTSSDRLVISTARQIIANLLLMRPKQTMQGQYIRVRYETHAVRCLIHRLAIRCNLNEKSAGKFSRLVQCVNSNASIHDSPASSLDVGTQEIVETQHMLFFREFHMIGDVLQDFRHQHEAAFH